MTQLNYENQDKDIYQTINPFTEEKLESFKLETLKEAQKKIKDSHKAFRNWSKTSIEEREKIMLNMANLLDENKDELAQLMTAEMGKLLTESKQEVDLCIGIFKFCADNAKEFLSDEKRDFSQGSAIVSYRPMGVILSIQPWNFPLYQVIRYSAHTITAGNTTVCKHAQNVWSMAKKIEELYLEAGLAKNVFQSLYVEDEIIEKLIEMDEVKGVTLTGSPKAGKAVAKKAGEYLKKTVIELGGSDPYLVLEDADIDMSVETLYNGRIQNAGQVCTSPKRFIIADAIYDEFKKKLLSKVKEAQMGDPMESTTKLSPMAREDLLEKIHEQVDETIEMGATCLTGGSKAKRKGFFYQPTVLENISSDMPAYKEEFFGPVFLLFRAKDEQEAIKIANDTSYGLGSGVFTQNRDKALDIAQNKIQAGMCSINGITSARPNLPFGGINNSGYGREHDRFAFYEFSNIKTIFINEVDK